MIESETMKITILGSGTCVPSLERHSCSVLVSIQDRHILLDAGPGTMGQMLKAGVTINDIDLILLSHFHLDHCAEIAPFIFATKYPGFDRKKKLTLAGGAGLQDLFDTLNHAYNNYLDMPENSFQLIELAPDTVLNHNIDNIQITCSSVCHRPESLAFRLTDSTGFSLVYSGDTDYSESLIKLAQEADILICESATPDELKVSGHLTPSISGEIASKANVKKLVLTHFYPECDNTDILAQCSTVFKGEIQKARDLLVL